MIKVGLTGNIGSGKSTVAKIFRAIGVPVFDADLEAKKHLLDQRVISQIKSWWGPDILMDGEVDRKKLAALVFTEPVKLTMLNSLIHPLVKKDLISWLDAMKNHVYVIHEAAILFESGFYREFDKVITVTCPVALAVRRIIARDGLGEDEIRQRMKNQWGQVKKVKMSDFHIVNDGNTFVTPQVLNINKMLCQNEIKKG